MNTIQRLAKIREARGPLVREEKVTFPDGTTDVFLFRRLPFIELDKLRLAGMNDDGKFSSDRFAGNNARMVAAALVDEESNPVYTADAAYLEDPGIIDALAKAANIVNGTQTEAVATAEKNSVQAAPAAS